MSRAIPLLAVLCTGAALGALVVAVIVGGGRAEPGWIEEVAPLDPTSAIPEIAQLRESRGSVLAGTLLGAKDDAVEFSAALASESGAEPAGAGAPSIVEQLRRTAHSHEQQASELEERHEYAQADELRRLADEARQVARSLDAADLESVQR